MGSKCRLMSYSLKVPQSGRLCKKNLLKCLQRTLHLHHLMINLLPSHCLRSANEGFAYKLKSFILARGSWGLCNTSREKKKDRSHLRSSQVLDTSTLRKSKKEWCLVLPGDLRAATLGTGTRNQATFHFYYDILLLSNDNGIFENFKLNKASCNYGW